MSLSQFELLIAAIVVSAISAAVLTASTLRLNLVDVPNARSSHTRPTPRGGGLAIVVISTVGFLLAGWLGYLENGLAMGLVGGGVAVAMVGLADDRFSVPVRIRLLVHVGAAVWALFAFGETPLLQLGTEVIELDGIWNLVSILGIVWLLNLFNFMDGIDGLSASEAIFVALSGGLIAFSLGLSPGISIAAGILAGATLGFLVWNWPPAKIFMGDVGSGYIGYVIAVLVLAAAIENSASIFVWLTLGALFFVDATVTLARRILRGERAQDAHRTHAYQWLTRRWGSHKRVTVSFALLNLFLLLPLAVWSAAEPTYAGYIVLAAILVLTAVALYAGSGRAE